MACELSRVLASRTRAAQPMIRVSVGELLDRISILEIKRKRHTATHPGAPSSSAASARSSRGCRWHAVAWGGSARRSRGSRELAAVNEAIWEAEDALRSCEAMRDFGPRFVELARSVYRHNDRRAAIKIEINQLVGSPLVDEKLYADHRAAHLT